MIMWPKAVLMVAVLPLRDCFAKKSFSAPVSRGSRSAKTTNAQRTTGAVPDSRRRGYYNDQEDEEDEDFSLDRWSDNRSRAELGDELIAVDDWDSCGDSIGSEVADDSESDWRLDRDDRRHPPRRQQPSTPNFPAGAKDWDEGDDYDEDGLDDGFVGGPTRWKSDGDGTAHEDDFDYDYYDDYNENYDDYDEDNDDDFDDFGVPPRRGGPHSSKQSGMRPSPWTGHDTPVSASGIRRRSTGRGVPPQREASRGSVVRYQRGRRATNRGFNVRIPAVSGTAIASALRRQMGSAREAVEQASSIATSTSKRLKREVKLVVSGSWESALLKVTWPDDLPPDDDLVDSLVEAVKAFKLDKDVTKNSAEHRVLLRKLWTKMSEPDWRTVTKAVHLFHNILREISSQQHTVLKIFLGKMSREPDKRTGGRYFDLDVLCGVSSDGEAFRSFLDRYASYVFRRARDFNARFQELDNMRPGAGWENVVTMLVNAQKAIDLGVSCRLEPEEETEMTVLCLRNTAYDIRQLWRRYDSALAWVLEEAEDGNLFAGVDADVVWECLEEFKDFYLTRYKEVVAFLADAEELLGIYDVDVAELGLPPARDFCPTETADEDMEDEGDDEEGDNDGHADRAATSKSSSMRTLDVRPKGDGNLKASGATGTEGEVSSVVAEEGSVRVGPVAENDDAGGVGKGASNAGNAIRSSSGGKVGGVNGELRGDEVEEDSAEEGAVDEHVDDLTFFDDATQPEGTDPDWDRY